MGTSVLHSNSVTKKPSPSRRSIADLLAPLDAMVATSPSFVRQTGNSFEIDGERYELPRYQSMVRVLDVLQQLDITKVGLATEAASTR